MCAACQQSVVACWEGQVRVAYFHADNYEIGKQEIKQDFPFVVLKPTQGSGFACSVHGQRKKVLFAHGTWLQRRVLASQGTAY